MKCRSKPELARILGKNFDLSSFDYRSGRVLQSAIRKSKRLKGSSYDYARGKTLELTCVETLKKKAYLVVFNDINKHILSRIE